MFLIALPFVAGVVSLNQFSALPGSIVFLVLLIASILCWIRRRKPYTAVYRTLVVFVLGISWAQIHALYYLSHVLPETLAGKDVVIQGRIVGIPVTEKTVQRIILEIDQFNAGGHTGPVPKRLKLSWYYGEPVRAGETWRFKVRLKPPYGFMNPGGFDYEAWLLQNSIHATGYIRKSEFNQKLDTAAFHHASAIRQSIAESISAALPASAFAGLIKALAVGDRASLDQDQWRVLINTGTNHLMAISGLHIGLAAAFGYWLCRRVLPARVMRLMPAQQLAMLSAVMVALIYAMLAGFAIPTQRALLMLVCTVGALLLRRATRPKDVLAFALLVVLLWDPASVMSAGFWFSFLAVAVIFYTLGSQSAQPRWMKWVWIQLVIALALFPLSLFMFQQTSLVAPLANLILVPYVSLLVVPLILLGMLILPFSAAAAGLLFSVADSLFRLIWPLLRWMADLQYAHWIKAQPDILLTLLALLGVGIMLTPRLRLGRISGILLLIPAIAWQPQRPAAGAYELNVLDVGQGLAIVIRTQSHVMVYDTGARFSDRLDSGQAVLLPFLRHAGIHNIDLLLISHGDGDHIGGAASLLQAYPQTPVLGQGIDQLPASSARDCAEGQQWTWDGVEFKVLHPDSADYTMSNNRSCVLKIVGAGGSLLITGDIEEKVERRLLSQNRHLLSADILIAPHHGSKTSSSLRFIDAVSPEIVIFAAGYRNRYQFPAAEIVNRYAASGSLMYMTGHGGAISIDVHPQLGMDAVRSYRERHRKYWHHMPPKLRQDD